MSILLSHALTKSELVIDFVDEFRLKLAKAQANGVSQAELLRICDDAFAGIKYDLRSANHLIRTHIDIFEKGR